MRSRTLTVLLLTAPCAAGAAGVCAAQTPTPVPMPEELTQKLQSEVYVEERLGDPLPLDRQFRALDGSTVALRDYFPGDGRPVALSFNYADCPSLCSSQLEGVAQVLGKVKGWTAGDNFRVLTIGLDPSETPARTREVRAKMAETYPALAKQPSTWAFLNGSAEDVRAVADAVGFGYTYDDQTGQYLHAPALILCTPDGRVARYLHGLRYPAGDFRLALAETADGKLRSAVDQVLLFCFAYDPMGNSYVLAAWNLTRLFLSVFALAVGGFLYRQIRKSRTVTAPHADA